MNYIDSAGHVDFQLWSGNRNQRGMAAKSWAGLQMLRRAARWPTGGQYDCRQCRVVLPLDSTQTVSELWWNSSSGWNFSNPTPSGAPNAAAGSPVVSLVNTKANTVQVHYIGTDDHVHELWWNWSWHFDDVTVAAGAYPAIP